MKKLEFDKQFLGLQIKWANGYDGNDIEYLNLDCLSGKVPFTTAACRYGRGLLHYRWAVGAERRGEVLSLTYRTEPIEWPSTVGWWDPEEMVGTTTIAFKSAGSCEPVSVTWQCASSGQQLDLEAGLNWMYRPTPSDIDELLVRHRSRSLVSRMNRSAQPQLRMQLLAVADPKCLISGTKAPEALEACHILPVENGGPDLADNALLLRRDLHALFDAGCLDLKVHAGECRVWVHEGVNDETYRSFAGNVIPGEALSERRLKFLAKRAELSRKRE